MVRIADYLAGTACSRHGVVPERARGKQCVGKALYASYVC
jgi:hypothetical protein